MGLGRLLLVSLVHGVLGDLKVVVSVSDELGVSFVQRLLEFLHKLSDLCVVSSLKTRSVVAFGDCQIGHGAFTDLAQIQKNRTDLITTNP